MSDSISPAKFVVLMGEFEDAIGVVNKKTQLVGERIDDLKSDFASVADLWQSPASATFEPLRTKFGDSADDLHGALEGILGLMRLTYQSYLDAENQNINNVSYQGDGDIVITFSDGSQATYDSSYHIIDDKLPDGTDYSDYDASGKPHHVAIPGEGSADISYLADGDAVYSFASGVQVTYDSDGHIVDEVLPGGAEYGDFDAAGKPHHVDVPGKGSADIAYRSDGDVVYSYADGSRVTYDAAGGVVDEVSSGGDDYSGFDGSGNPHHVVSAGGVSADIAYRSDGDVVYSYADGSRVTYDAAGHVVAEKPAGGTA